MIIIYFGKNLFGEKVCFKDPLTFFINRLIEVLSLLIFDLMAVSSTDINGILFSQFKEVEESVFR